MIERSRCSSIKDSEHELHNDQRKDNLKSHEKSTNSEVTQ